MQPSGCGAAPTSGRHYSAAEMRLGTGMGTGLTAAIILQVHRTGATCGVQTFTRGGTAGGAPTARPAASGDALHGETALVEAGMSFRLL